MAASTGTVARHLVRRARAAALSTAMAPRPRRQGEHPGGLAAPADAAPADAAALRAADPGDAADAPGPDVFGPDVSGPDVSGEADTHADVHAGWPYGSLVTMACDTDGAPLFLLSHLADHTRNLHADARASLLVDDARRRANSQTGPRVSLMGRIERSETDRHRRRFLARHPLATRYAAFADFAIYRMEVERAHYVGGFARARWLDGRSFLCGEAAASAVAAAETGIVAHMNADHADTVDLYARRLLRRGGVGWRIVGVDPDGCDLATGNTFARLTFPHPVVDAGTVRETLVALAREAREAQDAADDDKKRGS